MAELEEITLVPARISERFIAYIIDVFPFAAGYCLTMLYGLPQLGGAPAVPKIAVGWLAFYLGYELLGNLSGATIGKRLMGLRVLTTQGRPLGFIRSFLRAAGYALSTPLFNFGFLVALAHPQSRALHDLLAGSVVVEPRRNQAAEATILFAAATLSLIFLYASMLYLNLARPTPRDILAVQKAREGLLVMAQIEEAHKAARGAYTDSLQQLAWASGDVEQFRSAMSEIFSKAGFRIQAGNKGYRISGIALDRKATVVVVSGPPARVSP